MGCDIHSYCEFYNSKTKNWVVYKGKSFDHSYDLHDGSRREIILNSTPFYWRNYTLFAILADVRNGGNIIPISQPKGLPKNVSKALKKVSDDWGVDGHSHSYFTLEELLEYDDWEKIISDSDYDKGNHKTLGTYCNIDMPISVLLQYAKKKKLKHNQIRIVFWFDN